LYFSTFQSVDEEEFGGAWELTKEGFMTSFAGFLVIFSCQCIKTFGALSKTKIETGRSLLTLCK
jgi:hypothetical protein